MPRRKHAFIDRAKATTYQLVHHQPGSSTDAPQHVLVPISAHDATSPDLSPLQSSFTADHHAADAVPPGAIDTSTLDGAYEKRAYELGEFGLPDDGYNYAQHFKTIGGGGGVFMDAATGMPNPEAVVGSSSGGAASSASVGKFRDGVALREDVVEEGEAESWEAWKKKEDVLLAQSAIEEIKRERKRNKDLDEVFAALDSDGELGSSEAEAEAEAETETEGDTGYLDVLVAGLESGAERAPLEDDFVAFAEQGDGSEEEAPSLLHGVVEEYRKPRALDEHFETFMRGYELDDTDEDDNLTETHGGGVEDVGEFKALMTAEEMDGLMGDGGFLDDLAALQISGEDGADERAKGTDAASSSVDAAPGDTRQQTQRAAEYEQIANAEFERGMKGLLDSYTRVPGEEMLEAIDGVAVARAAIARGEEEERMKEVERDETGLGEESEGHDSELESQFEAMFEEGDDKWDCETILSTYSNLDNHPSVIDAPAGGKRRSVQQPPIIRLDPRTQAPVGYMPGMEEGAAGGRGGEIDFGSRRETVVEAKARTRDESKEEKRERKAAVKEAARERRALKSEMKKAFGTEHVKQNRHATALGKSKVAMHF